MVWKKALLAVLAAFAAIGCSRDDAVSDAGSAPAVEQDSAGSDASSRPLIQSGQLKQSASADSSPVAAGPDAKAEPPTAAEPTVGPPPLDELPAAPRSDRPKIDDRQLATAGIRKLTSRHLTLYTDLPAQSDIDQLPAIYDLAVPQWCRYFGVAEDRVSDWHVSASLIDRREPFLAVGLLPEDLPPFLHGFQRGSQIWLYEQPSVYYRRHLLLHEGTHAFMTSHLGGCGPPWYMEGIAELLGTHRWQDGQLQLNYVPRSADEVRDWGRIKILRDGFANGKAMGLMQIFTYDQLAHRRVEPYGWCWAACALFDNHPDLRESFRELHSYARIPGDDLTRVWIDRLEPQWLDVVRQWQLMVAHADYGYDVAREAIVTKPATPLPDAGDTLTIAADRGWQSSGWQLPAGRRYRITASGRFQIAADEQIWWCEPGGITIRYAQGKPLGVLLAAVIPAEDGVDGLTALATPQTMGLQGHVQPAHTGVLYLRVNDLPSELHDNAGQIRVHVEPLEDQAPPD